MKWVIEEITREQISSLNVWLAENTDWEPISVQKLNDGWTMVVRQQAADLPPPSELN